MGGYWAKEHSRKMKNSWSQALRVQTRRPRKRIRMWAENDKWSEHQEGSGRSKGGERGSVGPGRPREGP